MNCQRFQIRHFSRILTLPFPLFFCLNFFSLHTSLFRFFAYVVLDRLSIWLQLKILVSTSLSLSLFLRHFLSFLPPFFHLSFFLYFSTQHAHSLSLLIHCSFSTHARFYLSLSFLIPLTFTSNKYAIFPKLKSSLTHRHSQSHEYTHFLSLKHMHNLLSHSYSSTSFYFLPYQYIYFYRMYI